MKPKQFKFILILFITQLVFSQSTVTGVVKDESGIPLISASVVVENTNRGVTTDFDGNFTIEAKSGEVLVVSYVGYVNKKITITNQSNYSIVLSEDTSQLEEVVVVGYGKQKKITLTSSVQTVNFKDDLTQPVTNSGQLLYGRFSGVQLTQASGNPGADGSNIVIRGIGTFGNSTPLVVIDNIQYEGLAAFNNLAPADIESVSVLKDASASAIFGARGANGVIIVTTRTGKKGENAKVNYNGFFGVQEVTVIPRFLGAVDYANLINEKYANQNFLNPNPRYNAAQLQAIADGSLPDQFADTNWARAVLQQATLQNHNLSFSGASENTSYRLSLGFMGQNSIIKSKFASERTNMSFNLNSKIRNWLKINTVTNAFWRKNTGPTGGQGAFDGDNGIIYSFQRTAPTIPLFYSNGEYSTVDGAYLNSNPSLSTQNALRRGFFGDSSSNNVNISHITGVTIDITKNISFETRGSVNAIFNTSKNFTPTFRLDDWEGNEVSRGDLNTLTQTSNLNYRLLNENIITYSKVFSEDHNFKALIGHSAQYFNSDGFEGRLSGFPTNNVRSFNIGGVVEPAVSGGLNIDTWQSFFSRINYAYQGKYLAEFSIRRDGSSYFGPNNKYGTFPAASVGWRISEENFMKDIKNISSLKFRASWGVNGNDRINRYVAEATYNLDLDYPLGLNETIFSGAAATSFNPNIRWEETEQYNIGIDLLMFQNKLDITFDFFNRNSRDILYTNFPVPGTFGFTSLPAQNAASMLNRGIEFMVNYNGKVGDFKYTLGTNMTKFLKQEVTGLGDGGEETITNTSIIRIGEAFGSYYGWQAIGIFQNWDEVANSASHPNSFPGDIRYADLSGPNGVPDGIIDNFDRTVIGNPNPDFLLNFNTNFEYRGFDLSMIWQGVIGIDRLLMGNGNLPMADDRSNALTYWLDRWTPDNPSESLPRLGGNNNTLVSSFYVQDASFMRLKYLEFGYTFPRKFTDSINMSKVRLFFGAQNLLTFTKLRDFDPEGGRGNQSNRNAPLYKVFTFGVNLNL